MSRRRSPSRCWRLADLFRNAVGLGAFLRLRRSRFRCGPLRSTAVAVAAVTVHTIFLIISYLQLHHGCVRRAFKAVTKDLLPAAASSVCLAAVALPVSVLASTLGIPVLPYLLIIALLAARATSSSCAFGSRRSSVTLVFSWGACCRRAHIACSVGSSYGCRPSRPLSSMEERRPRAVRYARPRLILARSTAGRQGADRGSPARPHPRHRSLGPYPPIRRLARSRRTCSGWRHPRTRACR